MSDPFLNNRIVSVGHFWSNNLISLFSMLLPPPINRWRASLPHPCTIIRRLFIKSIPTNHDSCTVPTIQVFVNISILQLAGADSDLINGTKTRRPTIRRSPIFRFYHYFAAQETPSCLQIRVVELKFYDGYCSLRSGK